MTEPTQPRPKVRTSEERGIAELARIFPNERRMDPGTNEIGSWSTTCIYNYLYVKSLLAAVLPCKQFFKQNLLNDTHLHLIISLLERSFCKSEIAQHTANPLSYHGSNSTYGSFTSAVPRQIIRCSIQVLLQAGYDSLDFPKDQVGADTH